MAKCINKYDNISSTYLKVLSFKALPLRKGPQACIVVKLKFISDDKRTLHTVFVSRVPE